MIFVGIYANLPTVVPMSYFGGAAPNPNGDIGATGIIIDAIAILAWDFPSASGVGSTCVAVFVDTRTTGLS